MALQLGDIVPDFTQAQVREKLIFMIGQGLIGLFYFPILLTIPQFAPLNWVLSPNLKLSLKNGGLR